MKTFRTAPFALVAALTVAAGGVIAWASPLSAGAAQTSKNKDSEKATKDGAPGQTKRDGQASKAEFPPHNKGRFLAKNVQGQQAPELNVAEWVTSPAAADGKVVIVDFWATWCGPCVASIPHMSKISDDFKDTVAVIGLSDESRSKIEMFMKDDSKPKMTYAVGTDPQRRLSGWAGIRGIPHIMIISPDGIVRWQGMPQELKHDTIEQIVAASGLAAPEATSTSAKPGDAPKAAPEPIKRRG